MELSILGKACNVLLSRGLPEYDLEATAAMIPTSESDLRRIIDRIDGIGADELIFHPLSPEVEQIDRLEPIIG